MSFDLEYYHLESLRQTSLRMEFELRIYFETGNSRLEKLC